MIADNNMILKVAKAIHSARQQCGYSGKALWMYEPESIKELYLHSARAAVAAMGFETKPTRPEDYYGLNNVRENRLAGRPDDFGEQGIGIGGMKGD